MSDIIHLLPDSVANQIAAGEVIQRPASVIKELIENAVDAGATEIKIIIQDAGRTLIQVIDNGKGMTETDARMAFERHATSKIKAATDLFTLQTMGFRGEALPSICAISQVELRTRTAEDSIGVRLFINASNVEQQEPCVCDVGANFMVKNLFFNIPARRKFLKSDSVELANIMREFERLALVNSSVRMSIDTGNRKISLLPGNFKRRISELWKNNLNLQLLPVNLDTALVKIEGFVSRPEFARKRNPLQYLIVNGRNMKHPYFHKAILSCYDKLIPAGTQPCYFIRFEVDPASIDVNISPTKNEIKFEHEKEIWPILSEGIRAALGKYGAVPTIDFNSDVLPVAVTNPDETLHAPDLDIPADYNPFSIADKMCSNPFQSDNISNHKPIADTFRPTKSNQEWDSLYDNFINEKSNLPDNSQIIQQQQQKIEIPEESTAMCVQFAQKYIISTSREGLMIIDQHRAHLKILFEQFLAHSASQHYASQKVLFPETITLDESQQLVLEGIEDNLSRLGFTLTCTEGNTWKIDGVPSELSATNSRDVILAIIDSVSDVSENYGNEADPEDIIRRNIALVMARNAAIRRGDHLSHSEMESIIARLFSLSTPSRTPYGKPIYKLLDKNFIESLF